MEDSGEVTVVQAFMEASEEENSLEASTKNFGGSNSHGSFHERFHGMEV